MFRLGDRLRQTRVSHAPSISQRELAARAVAGGAPELTAAVVSRLELGYRDASWAEVNTLARALGVEPAWLAGGEPKVNPAAFVEPSRAPGPARDPRMPPDEVPRNGSATRVGLGEEFDRVQRALADRSLPPAVWRAWRAYGDQVRRALEETNRR